MQKIIFMSSKSYDKIIICTGYISPTRDIRPVISRGKEHWMRQRKSQRCSLKDLWGLTKALLLPKEYNGSCITGWRDIQYLHYSDRWDLHCLLIKLWFTYVFLWLVLLAFSSREFLPVVYFEFCNQNRLRWRSGSQKSAR